MKSSNTLWHHATIKRAHRQQQNVHGSAAVTVNQGASIPNFTIGTGVSRIELQLSPAFLPRSDQYTVLSGEYARDLTSAGTMGFVQFHARRNDTVNQFSTESLAAGVEHPWYAGDWRIRGTGTLSALRLGGEFYQQQSRFQTQISPPLALLRLPENFQFSLLAGVTHIVYPTLVHFDSSMAGNARLAGIPHGADTGAGEHRLFIRYRDSSTAWW